MGLAVVGQRGDSLLIADREAGPGAIVYRDGDGAVFHIDTALAHGYWQDSNASVPDLPSEVRGDLDAFNARWKAGEGARREALGYDNEDPSLDDIRAMAAEPDETDTAQRAARSLALLGVTRALGHDVTPGHDELHHYWTVGPGLAKWAESPKPWTTLVAHLTKYVGLRKAKIFASRWFIEVFHYAAGSDLNRVSHGHPPRGHRVGPG